ncbi:phospholipase A1 member A isoform X2 [Manduca sexta]|uniref:Esterase n=1 Tax=Manduca sexta TaxID=7130 RepID=A0A977T703_MANSE|nr:phospholipase A1 member A isoform X2 [Manduca sexta]UXP71903.1 esterase [Manduca sexta]
MVRWLVVLMLVTLLAGAKLQDFSALLPPILNARLDELVRAASDTCDALPVDILFSRQYTVESPNLNIVEFTRHGQRSYRVTKAHLKTGADASQLVVYVPGWWNTPSDESTQAIVKALLTKHPIILVLDTQLAFCRGYVSSASRVKSLAQALYSFLKKLNQNGYPLPSAHLIGFSLGAHVVGIVGKMVRNKLDTRIGRITALDPAKPCFSKTKYRIDVNDAVFTQVVHSSPGVLGVEEPVGHVDVYLNGIRPQPECMNVTVTLECDHSQAWRAYTKSVLNKTALVGRECSDWGPLVDDKCDGREAVVGYGVSSTLRGIYVVKTVQGNIVEPAIQLRVFNPFDIHTWW